MGQKVRCICINDKDRPEEIPPHRWPVKDEQYHITHIYYHPMQGVQGVDLKEIGLTTAEYPYESYRLDRFAINTEDIPNLILMLRDCTSLNDVDINKLIEEFETVEGGGHE